MESKEYFEKVMQDYNQNRNGRSLRKYCKDEAIDYNWLIEYKKNYPTNRDNKVLQDTPATGFIPLTITGTDKQSSGWQVSQLVLSSPEGDTIEIKSTNMIVIAELLRKMA